MPMSLTLRGRLAASTMLATLPILLAAGNAIG